MQGGSISVESEKGKGATFTIHFAIDSEERGAKAEARGRSGSTAVVSGPAATGAARPCVLVVEDDADSQGFMKTLLSARYDVLCAASGEEARRQLARSDGNLHVILMDVSLKGGEDGLSLTRHLRSQPQWKTIPIIGVTAHARRGDRERVLAAGCTAYLQKPFDRKDLLALMASLLDPSIPLH